MARNPFHDHKRESTVEDAVVDWAESNGWESRKIAYIGRRGCPDRLFFGYGKILLVEFKKPGKTADPHQKREINRFGARWVNVPVIDTVEKGVTFLLDASEGFEIQL